MCVWIHGTLRVAYCRLAVCVCVRERERKCVREFTARSAWSSADSQCGRERERVCV